MKLLKADPDVAKGWYAGPWSGDLDISVGYANQGIDESHMHTRIIEIYLVARGSACIRVGEQTFRLVPGDVLVVEPGEPHTFLDSSPEYFHFVIHTPGLSGEEAQSEKRLVSSFGAKCE